MWKMAKGIFSHILANFWKHDSKWRNNNPSNGLNVDWLRGFSSAILIQQTGMHLGIHVKDQLGTIHK